MKTFTEFQATKIQRKLSHIACDALGFDADEMNFFFYDGIYFIIIEDDGTFTFVDGPEENA